MYRIVSQIKVQIASPDQGWSLTPGANHFEAEMPEAVAKQLAKLQKDGSVKVEILDGGPPKEWEPLGPKAPVGEG